MIAVLFTLIPIIAISAFAAGWITHGNYADRYRASRDLAAGLPTIGPRPIDSNHGDEGETR